MRVIPFLFAALVVLSCAVAHGDQQGVRFERAYALAPSEGVFAYSRISTDGKTLAYASETRSGGALARTITVVDLASGKVVFSQPGIDAYFSNDGRRMIYLASNPGRASDVAIRHQSGQITRNVAPAGLGDYFSWAVRDGRNLILTIFGNYYYLNGDLGVMPHSSVTSCPGIGGGDRPLISKDGRRITSFVRGTIVVRGLDNCDDVFDTGIEGAKADFSFDGRYIAMHAPKPGGAGYEILVVDLQARTVRRITPSLTGSSYFPSWTSDGRLSFRYDGSDYQGFMFASDVLRAQAVPLRTAEPRVTDVRRHWADVFPETGEPASRTSVVLVWGTWGAHSPDALTDLQRAQQHFAASGMDVSVFTATDPGSSEGDVANMLRSHNISLSRIPLAPQRLRLTEMHNQNPTTLLFRDGKLVDRKMGAQGFDDLVAWVGGG
jgi:hypothetical protein